MGPIHNLGNLAAIGPSHSGAFKNKANVQVQEDQVQLATVPLSGQVEQLQRTDPSSFQAVLIDAIRKLRAGATESSNPMEAADLLDMANRFQRLGEVGSEGAQSNSGAESVILNPAPGRI